MKQTDFILNRFPEICFGPGQFSLLPGRIKLFGSRVLLVLGGNSFQASGRREALMKALKDQGITHAHVSIPSEPTAGMIDEACDAFRGDGFDCVAAIGGGSVMDAGKALSAMLPKSEGVRSYLEGVGDLKHDGAKLPFIAVPTTAGTGSETTNNAVICERGPAGFKKSLRHQNFVPDVAIVDPQLMLSCPEKTTVLSGLDACSQLLESYTSTKANAFTDALALPAIALVGNSLRQACRAGNDMKARTGMAWAATVSGITLTNAGLGLIHGFASSIGGMYDVPHGAIVGTLIGVINRINIEKLAAKQGGAGFLRKYADAGKAFTGETGQSDEYYARKLADVLEGLVEELQVPKFSESGITEFEINEVIARTGHKNNPVTLNGDELEQVLRTRT